MAALVWDKAGEKKYELGTDRGVLYVQNEDGTYRNGVAWNGLTSVKESPEGGEQNKQYADNKNYISITAMERFKGTIEAFNYPNEFTYCDGKRQLLPGLIVSSQRRNRFGFCYRTKLGNDKKEIDYGYKLHIIYNIHAKPSEASRETKTDSPEAMKYSWEFTTDKVYCEIDGVKRAIAHVVIDSTKVNKENLDTLESVLYGSENSFAELPSPNEIYEYLTEESNWAEDQEDGVLYIQQVWNAQDQENGVLYVE